MVKLPPGLIFHTPRTPSFKGRWYVRDFRGGWVLAAWPRRQPTPANARVKEQQDRFRLVNQATLYMDAHQQQFARDIAAVTQLAPRDLLVMALYGRGWYISTLDGRKLISMAARNSISEVLDAIAQTPGSVMFRGEDWWSPLDPGTEGFVLTMGADGHPAWAPGGGGGGGMNNATLVTRTSDETPSSTWPRFLSWQGVPYDNLGAWNPATPDRLTLPISATAFRLTSCIEMTTGTNNVQFYIGHAADGGGNLNGIRSAQSLGLADINFSSRAASIQSPWLPTAAFTYVQQRLNRAGAQAAGALTGSWMLLEAV